MPVPLLHTPAVRASIEQRIRALRPDAKPRWGKMSVDQMLWHVNGAMSAHLGEYKLTGKPPMPRPIIKFMVLKMPWMKNAPTNPSLRTAERYDFDAERARCLDIIARFAARPMADSWPDHSTFGRMSGRDVSRLQAKHLDHHLTQFGV